ncbi:FHA domain-containing protein [Roseiconus lacunae]|uniref:FHA domain-containing protein n=1 Tax=Roseiconus lacunae TaxID=2605694 RepID=UPI001E63C65C|nr:FHA domain-containing protein [Roseiconus lacunae]MCD0458499.1 FHA domain-containing protein [Roseiconus lacunae]
MPVELVMTEGSRAGTAAPIQIGYYLVGRNKECQIRPKSKSVSRRHSLLLHNEDGFGVLDLKSTGGTYVNGERLTPHQWHVLADGDELRFGKVGFTVSMKMPAFASVSGTEDAASGMEGSGLKGSGLKSSGLEDSGAESGSDTNAVVDPPASWQNFDVAEFLEAEDQVDQEIRYGQIRGEVASKSAAADDEIALDELEADAKAHETFVGSGADEGASDVGDKVEIEVDAKPKKKPPQRKIDPKEYKRKPRRSIQLPSFGLDFGGSWDWKTIAMFFVAIGIVGFLGYQIYTFSSGPSIEVRQNLD